MIAILPLRGGYALAVRAVLLSSKSTSALAARLVIFFMILIAAGGTAWPARAADLPSEVESLAIRDVIERQIAAFRRDDGEMAFAFASPSIRRMFGTVETFMAMVRGSYQAVYRPQTYRFGSIQIVNGLIVQKVHIVGPDGRAVTAFYIMEQQSDGSWRIAGCSLGPPEEEAA